MVKGSEFLQKVRRLARERSIEFSWHPDKGKGSHGVLKFGTYHTMLRQPGLSERDFP